MAVCEGCSTVGSCVEEARQLLLLLSLGFLLVKTGLVTSSFILPLLWGKQEISLAECRAQCLASDRYSGKTSLSSVAMTAQQQPLSAEVQVCDHSFVVIQ